MPVVPRLESGGIQTRQLDLGQRNTRVDFASESYRQAGDSIASAIQIAKDAADSTEVMRADKELTNLEMSIQNDALNKKGKDAFGLEDDINLVFDDSSSKIRESLTTDRQKSLFDKIREDKRNSINRTIQRHVSNEINSYQNQETESYLKTQKDYALTNSYDTEKVGYSINSQIQALTAHAKTNGLGPEWLKQKTQDVESKTHALVINKMIGDGNDISAEQYYNKYKSGIVGDDLAQVNKEIEVATLRGKSQRMSDEIWSKGKTYLGSIEDAKQIDDPKLRDAVINRIGDLQQQKKLQESENMHKLNLIATDIIDKTGDYYKIPPAIIEKFTNSERASLQSYAGMRREGKNKMNDDIKVWGDINTLKAAAPDKFLEIDFTSPSYLTQLTPSSIKSFMDDQNKLREGKANEGYMRQQEIVNDAVKSMKLDKDSDDALLFKRIVDEQVQSFSLENGRKPNNNEMRQITDDLSVKVVTDKGWLWDTKKRKFELTDKEAPQDISIDDIPKSKIDQIKSFLEKKGKQATEKNIKDLYLLEAGVVSARR